MSALGQKQTYAVQQPMSALLPTAKADIRLDLSLGVGLERRWATTPAPPLTDYAQGLPPPSLKE